VESRLGVSGTNDNAAELRFYYAGSGSTSNRLDLSFFGLSNGISLLASGSVGIGTTSPQTGSELTVTNATASGTTYGGYFSDATTGSGYGVYGTLTAHGNTGYAGYFKNTDTSSSNNFGVYGLTLSTSGGSVGVQGECDAAACQGVWGSSTNGTGVLGTGSYAGLYGVSSSTGAGYGVYGSITGHSNTGYAGYFINTDTSTNLNYGVYGKVSSSNGSTSVGIEGEGDCNSCSGVYGFSANNVGVNAVGGNYGIYAVSGSTGAGIGVFGLEIENATLRRDFNTYKAVHP
jgi:hypothetical protein